MRPSCAGSRSRSCCARWHRTQTRTSRLRAPPVRGEARAPSAFYAAAMPRVTIGIPACDDDPAVVAAALAATDEVLDADRIVVDMSHTDAIAAAVRAHRQPVRYVAFAESSGVSASR